MEVLRIVTHAGCFDGLISALFLREVLGIEDVVFVYPSELRDGSFKAHANDAFVDLSYPPGGCALWIDHHQSKAAPPGPGHHYNPDAKSCAGFIRQIYGEKLAAFSHLAVLADKIDSADFTAQDIAHPDPALQLAMTLPKADGAYYEFLLEQLSRGSLETIVKTTPVQQRFAQAWSEQQDLMSKLDDVATVRGNVVVLDLTTAAPYLLRFAVYDRFNVSVAIITEPLPSQRLHVFVGENIYDHTNTTDIGALCASYGGGGHKTNGGCTIPAAQRDEIIDQMVAVLNQN